MCKYKVNYTYVDVEGDTHECIRYGALSASYSPLRRQCFPLIHLSERLMQRIVCLAMETEFFRAIKIALENLAVVHATKNVLGSIPKEYLTRNSEKG